ncbi:MAG: Asp-tRNA(Asn)/Glu-tRNA(Gln) amidotransferase subunit GatC [Nitrospirales bacterium]|jgi:aspartyl-tRNA(Asn)/glutamyl-tRNA(Gln) amidotransferase subunit C
MASISHKEVEHVAQLARLDLTEPEKNLFGEQLSQILTFVGQLQEVSTEGIPPTASVADQESVLREDLPREGLSQEQALSNAPEAHHGFFVVPKILGKK